MMSDNSIRSPFVVSADDQANSGFALVIAISLMAFVIILLLSITTIIRVETVSSEINKNQLLAKNNALLGLQIALGNLQVAAGPDQRITSNAAIMDGVDSSKVNYTAVWDVTPDVDTGEVAVLSEPLAWLVSGAEDVDTDESSDTEETSDTEEVSGYGATATESSWPELVSARSDATIEAVRAEPVSILSSSGVTRGEFAWWVGDEGVKAKFNLAESTYFRESSTDEDSLTDSVIRLGVSPRFGIEALDDFSEFYEYTDDGFVAKLRKLISSEQGLILNSQLSEPLADSYHDIGFYSYGLLTNTRDGGLKEDLTYYFENDLDGPTGAMTTEGNTVAMARITWEQLNSFYNLGYDLNNEIVTDETATDDYSVGDTIESITARAQTQDAAGVYPLLTMIHFNYGLTMSSDYNGTTPENPEDRTYSIYTHMRPCFVLSNPYNTTLEVSNYRIRCDASDATNLTLSISYADVSSAADLTVLNEYNNLSATKVTLVELDYKSMMRNLVFVVPEVILEPGEALYYSLADSTESSYGYDFNSNSGGYYSTYENFDSPQQFVFQADDDAGMTSIRLGSATEVKGDAIEYDDDGEQRIKPMYIVLSNKDGSSWFRTYTGESATLGDNETILQDIGAFRYWEITSGDDYHVHQGYWAINNLPNSLMTFDYTTTSECLITKNDQTLLDTSTEISKKLSTTSISAVYMMHGAMNANSSAAVRNLYTGFNGWATDFNIRAPRMSRYRWKHYTPSAFGFETFADGTLYYHWLRVANLNTNLNELAIASSFSWGAGYAESSGTRDAQVEKAILFDIPRLDDVTGQPAIASLGQLQHFNPGGWTENYLDDTTIDSAYYTLGNSPSYAIGNSYASPQIAREATTGVDEDADPIPTFSDVSYLLNEALFDQYFFSTIPQDTNIIIEYNKLLNKRLVLLDDAVADDDVRSTGTAAAEHLYVDGAFNVNSTSVDAWYTLLNSFRGFEFGDKESGQGIFPRSLYQSSEFVEGDVDGVVNTSVDDLTDDDDNAWAGWRHIEDDATLLTDRTLYKLAEAIVEEVKARGPFASMADFVNRRLIEDTDDDARSGLSGALQAALDCTINCHFGDAYDVNFSRAVGGFYPEHLGSGTISDIDGNAILRTDDSTVNASSAASIPGWVLQADLLQALAPTISVRSDTFTIRSYGNVLGPITGEVTAEAYVEAVVQRIPDYVDTSDSANTDTTTKTLSTTNQLAGRRFSIINLHFLDPSEI
jgi:hypothetical protein